ncbi:MAG: hypothetical protein ACTSQU_07095 [Promethearchaeota archaeon]
MTKSLKAKIIVKERINKISCTISVIGLILMIIGISVGFFPVLLGIMGLIGALSGGLIVLFQIIITVMMYASISWGGIGQEAPNVRSTTIILSIVNLLFLLFSGYMFYAGPIVGQLLLLALIITIVAGIIFKDDT